MATVFEGNIDKDSVRYEHHSLVLFYLRNAKRHADAAVENQKEGILLPDSVSAIIFSAMSVEAFLNETAEDLIDKEELDDFAFLRNKYRRRGKSSSVLKKLSIIFKLAFGVEVPQTLLDSVEGLVDLRNSLVHYKLSDTATKIIYPPIKNTKGEDGKSFMCIDFMQEPKSILPPLVQKISGEAAIRSFEVADSVLAFWNEQVEDKENKNVQPQT